MHVQLSGITKRFGETLANDGVTLGLGAGEVLALLGENGAGKSTLMKILYGFYTADSGGILIDGKPVVIDSPRAAMAAGIGMVFQHFNVIPALTVRENLLLAHPDAPVKAVKSNFFYLNNQEEASTIRHLTNKNIGVCVNIKQPKIKIKRNSISKTESKIDSGNKQIL